MSLDYRNPCYFHLAYRLPDGKTFLVPPPKALTATLSGSGWDLWGRAFGNQADTLWMDLDDVPLQSFSGAQLGARADAALPDALEVLAVDLDVINIQLEALASKRVPVYVQQRLSFADQYQAAKGPIRASPDSVEVFGPASVLAALDSVRTEWLVLNGLSASTTRRVAIEQDSNRYLRTQPQTVEVSIPVEQFTEKILYVGVEVLNPKADSIIVFPPRVRLSCSVGLSDYNELDAEDFRVAVDMADLDVASGQNSLPILLLDWPQTASGIILQPQAATFIISK